MPHKRHFQLGFHCLYKYLFTGIQNEKADKYIHLIGSSVVECLTGDRGAAGLSLTGVTVLWSLSKTHLS